MKALTGYETENFYKLDKKEYIILKNKDFLSWYAKKLNEGYKPVLDMTELQCIIDEIVSYFEFKYHNHFLYDSIHIANKEEEFFNSKELSKSLDIKELKYRLHHDYKEFLECNYPHHFYLKKERPGILSNEIALFPDKEGNLEEYEIHSLVTNGFLPNKKDVETVEDLLEKYLSINTKVDYTELKDLIYQHNCKIELRNKVLELIPLALLYSKNTIPMYGYIRAISFIRMFNKEYGLKMNTNKIDKIANIDYNLPKELPKKETPKVRRLINKFKA